MAVQISHVRTGENTWVFTEVPSGNEYSLVRTSEFWILESVPTHDKRKWNLPCENPPQRFNLIIEWVRACIVGKIPPVN